VKINKIFFGILLCIIHLNATAGNLYFNVTDYGAANDGKTLSTLAIQKTIDACAAAGGGKVIFPAGKYLTGPLFLRNNIEVEIGSGATLLFDDNISQTPVIDGSWEGIERKVYASLFTGHNLENVSVTGRGKLDGQGKTWWAAYLQTVKVREKFGITDREPENPEGSDLKYPRPRVINLYNCKNVLISGITIINSPAWTIHPVYCSNVIIKDISIIQPYDSPNTDGINPESCNNVRITGCFIDCGDDCITLKSGYNEHGRKKGIPCENIVISGCTFSHGRSAIGIGSEMSGGVRNVTISNCVFQGTLRGLRLKTGRPRGGVVENIRASDIIMENIREGISIDMYYESGSDKPLPVTEETPHFRNIRFSNITGTNIKEAINISGLPEAPVQDLELYDIYFESEKGVKCQFANNLVFRNVTVKMKGPGPVFNIRKSSRVQFDNNVPGNSGVIK
jgi:polygalacturonase